MCLEKIRKCSWSCSGRRKVRRPLVLVELSTDCSAILKTGNHFCNENDKILTKPKNTKKPKIEQNQNFTKTTKSHRGQNLNQNDKTRTKILTKRQKFEPNSTKNPKFSTKNPEFRRKEIRINRKRNLTPQHFLGTI